jgi:hypothetical protein
MSPLFRDALEGVEMRNHLVSQPFGRHGHASRRARHADMTPREFVGLVAGWSTALVVVLALSVFIRFIG